MLAHMLSPTRWQAGAAMVALVLLAGCASKPAPQGYGVGQEGTAAEAQRQMQQAEQSTKVDTVQTYLDLITQMQQAGQWYASLAHTEAFEQQYGANTQVRLLRADALRNTGQFAQAQLAYTALLQGGDTNTAARARRGMGLLHASQGQYAQAVTQLEMARKLNPIDANVLSDLAYAHMLNGQLAPAQLPVLQAAQLAPTNARVQLNLALYWLASGNEPEAARLLQRLSQPQAKNMPALIDQNSLQTLQTQLASVQQAVQARASAPIAQTQAPSPQLAAAPAPQALTPPAPVPAQPQAALQMQTQITSAHPTLIIKRQITQPAVVDNAASKAPQTAAAAENQAQDNPL